MATKKMVIYYRVTTSASGKINRGYPEFDTSMSDDDNVRQWKVANPARIYVDHEDHAVYAAAFNAAGLVGADEDDIRDWLRDRMAWLIQQRAQAQAAKQAALIPPNGSYGGAKPGDIVRDQHGRSGRVPHVPLEVFRDKPLDPDTIMDAVRASSKGGGGTWGKRED